MSDNRCPHCGAADDGIGVMGYCGRCGKDVHQGAAQRRHLSAPSAAIGSSVTEVASWRSWLAAAIACFMVFILLCALGVVSGALSTTTTPRQIQPTDLLTAESPQQLPSDYVRLEVVGAMPVGYEYEEEKDGRHQTAHLLAVPINDRLLIVRAPLNHQGVALTGILMKMPVEVQVAILEADQRGLMEDLANWKARWQMLPHKTEEGTIAGVNLQGSVSLRQLCLPLILDATTAGPNGWGQRLGLITLMGLFLAGSMLSIRRAARLRRRASGGSA